MGMMAGKMMPWYTRSDLIASHSAGVGCRHGCPVHTDAGRYAQAIARGEFEEAVRIARARNPLVSVCAYICPHPCEDLCARGQVDDPLALRELKRHALAQVRPDSVAPDRMSDRGRGHRIAVVGGGPAGLSAAHDLALLGYGVVIFEAAAMAGGVPATTIPRFRLPRAALRQDVESIIRLGVDIRTNQRLAGPGVLRDLRDDGFERVIVATGYPLGKSIPIPGNDLPGVVDGIELLQTLVARRPVSVGREVVVIGGGDTAVDVARAVLRADPHPPRVTLVCRQRSLDRRAHEEQARAVVAEGIRVLAGWIPRRIVGEDRVAGLQISRVATYHDGQGRYRPTPRPGTREIIPAETIIVATGRRVEPDWPPETEPGSIDGTRPGGYLWRAAGDLAGGTNAIEAVADGQKFAAAIDREITGGDERPALSFRIPDHRAQFLSRPVVQPRQDLTGDDGDAAAEGKRCLDCWSHVLSVADEDASRCLLCSRCVQGCPGSALRFESLDALRPNLASWYGKLEAGEAADALRKLSDDPAGSQMTLLVCEDDRCVRCGLCVERCPAGCLSMSGVQARESHG